ncbi:MAG: anti-sigma factor antagonist [Patescibacteria group bacterium]
MTDASIFTEDVAGTQIKIVHISGQLDESNVDEKIKEVYHVLELNPKGLNLVCDLEKLEYMNSKSIGYLTDLYGKISDAGGQIAIANAKPNILDILQVVGLTQLIKTFGSIDDAKSSFSAQPAAPTVAPVAPASAPASPVQPVPAQPAVPIAQPTEPQAPQPTAQEPPKTA